MTTQPHFIVIEGPDGAGKTTQIGLLKKAFAAAGLKASFEREPGGTQLGEIVRPIVKTHMYPELTVGQELVLFNAARISFIHEVIKPALARGEWFIADRYAHSTLAYQVAGGLDPELVAAVVNTAVGNVWPSLAFIFDISPNEALKRKEAKPEDGTRMEDKGIEFHQRVRENYMLYVQNNPSGTVVVDATQTVEAVHGQIIGELNRRFGLSLQLQA
jgi:dTMP kinase